MNHKTEQLNELIAIVRDGQRFYEHAPVSYTHLTLPTIYSV